MNTIFTNETRKIPELSFRYVRLLFAVLVLTACVSEPVESPRLPTDAEVEQYNASVPPEEHIICRMETPVGTNIPKRVCRLVKDISETSDFHREQLRRVLR
jgi:hypothetical protein